MIYKSNNEKDTFNFAKEFAKKMEKGAIFGLIGDLGAGKTTFVQGMAKGLGVKQKVTSPTFVVMKIYDIFGNKNIKKLAHVDAYRLKDSKDLTDIGVDEYFNRNDTVIVIEWAEEIKKILPKSTRFISIAIKGENYRLITVGD